MSHLQQSLVVISEEENVIFNVSEILLVTETVEGLENVETCLPFIQAARRRERVRLTEDNEKT